MAKTRAKTTATTANLGFEAKLWVAAAALRNNMDEAHCRPSSRMSHGRVTRGPGVA